MISPPKINSKAVPVVLYDELEKASVTLISRGLVETTEQDDSDLVAELISVWQLANAELFKEISEGN